MAIPIKGLPDLRTLSGRVDQTFIPHKAYMKLACLEMEISRRGKERESAMHRVKNIDDRFKEIESEKNALLLDFVEGKNGEPLVNTPGMEPKPAPRRGAKGLKLRY